MWFESNSTLCSASTALNQPYMYIFKQIIYAMINTQRFKDVMTLTQHVRVSFKKFFKPTMTWQTQLQLSYNLHDQTGNSGKLRHFSVRMRTIVDFTNLEVVVKLDGFVCFPVKVEPLQMDT